MTSRPRNRSATIARRFGGLLLAAAFAAVALPGACGGGAATGEVCDYNDDCAEGFCCRSKECDRGMCTFDCRSDRDCPSDMACEHDTCFFRCGRDADCDPGFRCEHGNTVCEVH